MKRTLFSICALAAVLVGCSKSDVVDAPNIDTPISFDVYSGKVPVSKATSINDQASLGSFVAYAYEPSTTSDVDYTKPYAMLNGKNVNYIAGTAGSNGTWGFAESETIYWPGNTNELTFIAYSNNLPENTTYVVRNINSEGDSELFQPVLDVKIPEIVSYQKDIVVAKETHTKKGGAAQTVNLQFEHILSRVYFNVKSNRNLTIKSVKLSGKFNTSGIYNIGGNLTTEESDIPADNSDNWINTSPSTENEGITIYDLLGTDSFTYNGTTPSALAMIRLDTADESDSGYYMMLMPTENPDATIEVVYQFTDEDEIQYKVTQKLNDFAGTDTDFKFEQGYSYKFVLNLDAASISFTVDITDWSETGTNQSHELTATPEVSEATSGEESGE